jgi:hypothetical protein
MLKVHFEQKVNSEETAAAANFVGMRAHKCWRCESDLDHKHAWLIELLRCLARNSIMSEHFFRENRRVFPRCSAPMQGPSRRYRATEYRCSQSVVV